MTIHSLILYSQSILPTKKKIPKNLMIFKRAFQLFHMSIYIIKYNIKYSFQFIISAVMYLYDISEYCLKILHILGINFKTSDQIRGVQNKISEAENLSVFEGINVCIHAKNNELYFEIQLSINKSNI